MFMKRVFKAIRDFLVPNGFLKALVENIVKLIFFIIVLYIFDVAVW